MKRRMIRMGLKYAAFAAVGVAAAGFLTMSLWNWLIPALFALPAIHFGQALGLVVLARILFGGFRGGGGRRMHWRGPMGERWQNMTPEQRATFRSAMCGKRNVETAGVSA